MRRLQAGVPAFAVFVFKNGKSEPASLAHPMSAPLHDYFTASAVSNMAIKFSGGTPACTLCTGANT